MGAWSADTFGNDTACDWSYELEKVDDLELVRETLGRVLDVGDEYLDSDIACEALAACEVIARLKGNWGVRNPYTETVDNWVETHSLAPPNELVEAGRAAIERILRPPSELLDLWDEGGSTEWGAAIDDLRKRVAS